LQTDFCHGVFIQTFIIKDMQGQVEMYLEKEWIVSFNKYLYS
jgi:hypothetical protein